MSLLFDVYQRVEGAGAMTSLLSLPSVWSKVFAVASVGVEPGSHG